jgi:hypothetical protein
MNADRGIYYHAGISAGTTSLSCTSTGVGNTNNGIVAIE